MSASLYVHHHYPKKATIISLLDYNNSEQSRLLVLTLTLTLGFLLQSFPILQSILIFTPNLKIRTDIFNMTYETLHAFYLIAFV